MKKHVYSFLFLLILFMLDPRLLALPALADSVAYSSLDSGNDNPDAIWTDADLLLSQRTSSPCRVPYPLTLLPPLTPGLDIPFPSMPRIPLPEGAAPILVPEDAPECPQGPFCMVTARFVPNVEARPLERVRTDYGVYCRQMIDGKLEKYYPQKITVTARLLYQGFEMKRTTYTCTGRDFCDPTNTYNNLRVWRYFRSPDGRARPGKWMAETTGKVDGATFWGPNPFLATQDLDQNGQPIVVAATCTTDEGETVPCDGEDTALNDSLG